MISSQFFDSVLISDISVVSGVRDSGRAVDNRASGRKRHGFLYIYSGAATFYADGKSFSASAGNLLYIPQNKKYKIVYTAESTAFVVVNFALRDLCGTDAFLFDDIRFLFKDPKNSPSKIMAELELCSTSKSIGSLLRKKELMYRLLGSVCGDGLRPNGEGAHEPQIAHGVNLLERTYLENLPITRYAQESYVSVNTFRRAFRKQFGMSPLKYRNLMRIDRAKELLYDGDFTVAEVAYAVGFENVGYFCRCYRQITGETPTETKQKNG